MIKIISFDVFDTIIFRFDPIRNEYLRNPDDMFLRMEKAHKVKGFADARLCAEEKARQSKLREVTIDDIYVRMPKKLRQMRDMEIRWEIDNARPNAQMLDFLTAVKKPIIITSDMYLPSDTISQMLARCGVSKQRYSKLYVSAQHNASKSDGLLYEHIIQDLKVNPDEILHIGDNKKSDFEMAKRMGLNALWYSDGQFHTK
jgi:HAD superfamily hydrolase (TIGR01549 family)